MNHRLTKFGLSVQELHVDLQYSQNQTALPDLFLEVSEIDPQLRLLSFRPIRTLYDKICKALSFLTHTSFSSTGLVNVALYHPCIYRSLVTMMVTSHVLMTQASVWGSLIPRVASLKLYWHDRNLMTSCNAGLLMTMGMWRLHSSFNQRLYRVILGLENSKEIWKTNEQNTVAC